MMIKIYFNGDCYAINDTNIDTFIRLQDAVHEKVKVNAGSSLAITVKIDGWYMVDLSTQQIYLKVLSKVWQARRLVLEVIAT